jgi:16S rRNA (cytosine967-C5)-methyltransferase
VVIEVLADVREEGQLADRALSRVLRREQALWSGERRAAAEAVYGVLRQERMIDAILGRALPQIGSPTLTSLSPSQADLLRLAVRNVFDGEIVPPGPMAQAVAERAAGLRDQILAEARDPWDRLALQTSLPRWLVARLGERLGAEEAEALFLALNRRAPLTVRANLLKTTRAALADRLLAEGVASGACRFSPWGLTLDQRINAFGLPSFRDGLFELQDEGSQLLARLCGENPGAKVIDACAGAGGKTLALGAAMGTRGELWALDSREDRLEQLKPRARRAGVQNLRIQPIGEDGPLPSALDRLIGRADLVLVDAPCSGIGALRRNPDARRRLTEESIAEHARIQHAILTRVAPLVRPGGRLIYATCSLLWEENENVVERFVSGPGSGSGFSLQPPASTLGEPLALAIDSPLQAGPAALRSEVGLRLWPQRHGTDGFFGAVLVKQPG